MSIDPTSKANGGKLPGVVKGQEEKALDTAVFSAQTNVLSGPVKTPFGYYIFEVQSVTPGSQQTLKQAEASIKSQLDGHAAAVGAEQVRQGIQKEVAGQNRMPFGLHGRRLQGLQSPEDDVDRRAGDAVDDRDQIVA